MRDPENIKAIAKTEPDYIGLIFYDKSPRYVGKLDPKVLDTLPEKTKRVGVFVNAGVQYIRKQAERYTLDMIQLHGEETPDFCEALRQEYTVIKAFGIENPHDLDYALQYEGLCDYFLFDAKTPKRGGAGVQFDHSVLKKYTGSTPYFLSGGIAPDDATTVSVMRDNRCVAIDINSRFEMVPGLKDAEAVGQFINEIKTNKNQTI